MPSTEQNVANRSTGAFQARYRLKQPAYDSVVNSPSISNYQYFIKLDYYIIRAQDRLISKISQDEGLFNNIHLNFLLKTLFSQLIKLLKKFPVQLLSYANLDNQKQSQNYHKQLKLISSRPFLKKIPLPNDINQKEKMSRESAGEDDTQPRRVGQSNKVKPRELKAIQKGYQQFQTQLDREKESKQNKSGEKKDGGPVMEDREMKKMRMYEEMFQKQKQMEERKQKLKEKREIRKMGGSVTASPSKEKRNKSGDIDVISEADQDSVDESSVSRDAGEITTRKRGRGGYRPRGRGSRGRRGRGRGRGNFSHRKNSKSRCRRAPSADSESSAQASDVDDEDDESEDEECQSQQSNKDSHNDDDLADEASDDRPKKKIIKRRPNAAKSEDPESMSDEQARHHQVSKFRKTSKKRRVEDDEDEDGDIVMKDTKNEVDKKQTPKKKRSSYALSADEANSGSQQNEQKVTAAKPAKGQTNISEQKSVSGGKGAIRNIPAAVKTRSGLQAQSVAGSSQQPEGKRNQSNLAAAAISSTKDNAEKPSKLRQVPTSTGGLKGPPSSSDLRNSKVQQAKQENQVQSGSGGAKPSGEAPSNQSEAKLNKQPSGKGGGGDAAAASTTVQNIKDTLSVRKLTSKEKEADAKILFGDQQQQSNKKESVAATNVGMKRPRLLSNQHEKELKELATGATPASSNNDPGKPAGGQIANGSAKTDNGAKPSSLNNPEQQQRAQASVSKTGTKRVMVQSQQGGLKEVVKPGSKVQGSSDAKLPQTSTQQKPSQQATEVSNAAGGSQQAKNPGTSGQTNSTASKVVKKQQNSSTSQPSLQQQASKTTGAKNTANTTSAANPTTKTVNNPESSSLAAPSISKKAQPASQSAISSVKTIQQIGQKQSASALQSSQQQTTANKSSQQLAPTQSNSSAKTAQASNSTGKQAIAGSLASQTQQGAPTTSGQSSKAKLAEQAKANVAEKTNNVDAPASKANASAAATAPGVSSEQQAIIAATKALMQRKHNSAKVQTAQKQDKEMMAQGQGQGPIVSSQAAAPSTNMQTQGSQGHQQVLQQQKTSTSAPSHQQQPQPQMRPDQAATAQSMLQFHTVAATQAMAAAQHAAMMQAASFQLQQQQHHQQQQQANTAAAAQPAQSSTSKNTNMQVQFNPCGALPLFQQQNGQRGNLMSYNDFMHQLTKQAYQTQDGAAQSGAGENATGNASQQAAQNSSNAPESNQFCLVQTKAKLSQELQMMKEQYCQTSIALNAYRMFDQFCLKLNRDFGI